jgi:hypothetical protein
VVRSIEFQAIVLLGVAGVADGRGEG